MLSLCERDGLELPEVNVKLHGWTVDFLWREQGLVVETDGHGNHHTPAQIDRDRRKDLALRSAGLTVNRYSRQQVEHEGETVVARCGTDARRADVDPDCAVRPDQGISLTSTCGGCETAYITARATSSGL